jgi:intergrase/recombinase
MGLPGFEPESIEPKSEKTINWQNFKQYVDNKYAKAYALSIFEHSRKYYHLLENVNGILSIQPTTRNNTINALTALSRFLGTYDSFMSELKCHGVKRYKPDAIQSFTRIFNGEAHKGLGEWYRRVMSLVNENEKLYLEFMLLSGVRAMEGLKSFNLIVELGSRYRQEYYNEKTLFLEHFRFPKLFLRSSKNLYVSAVPPSLLEEISKSTNVSYNAIDKKLNNAYLNMRIKQLRSFYATTMREQGLLSEQIDLLQGRIGKSVFLHHYFKADPLLLSKKILQLLRELKNQLLENESPKSLV